VYYAPSAALGAKRMAQPARPLAPVDVNSGVTWFVGGRVHVLVYRREEATKVLVHELVHALGIDRFSPEFEAAGVRLAARHGVVSRVPVRLNETYTELLASYVHVTLRTALAGDDPLALPGAIDRRLRAMKRHFERQAHKIMCAHYSDGTLLQDTHVFEYYVVKAALFRRRTPAAVLALMQDPEGAMLTALEAGVGAYMSRFACDLRMLPA
jgi:hypothetical protein